MSAARMNDDGWPTQHFAMFEKLREDGLITDWEPMGEWDYTRAPGPGRTTGVFTPERTETESGDICYRVWVKENTDEEGTP